jgi:hypothetical protein
VEVLHRFLLPARPTACHNLLFLPGNEGVEVFEGKKMRALVITAKEEQFDLKDEKTQLEDVWKLR